MIDLDQSLRDFSREFDALTKDRPAQEVTLIQRAMALQALNGVVDRTPVDTGRARGNWQMSVGEPSSSVLDRTDIGGDSVKRDGESVIDNVPPFDVLWLTNNLEYIAVLEHGLFVPSDPGPSKDDRPGRIGRVLVQGGYSTQAPQGMVALTVEEIRTQFGE